MRRMDRLKTLLPAALALVLVLGSAATPSQSYFTTYVTASGSKLLELKNTDITIDEKVDTNTKSVQIKNTGETECYVRVKLFCANMEALRFTPGDGWIEPSDSSDYWYYSVPLQPGDAQPNITTVLKITIDGNQFDKENLSSKDFNVIVVAECAPVLYDKDGNALLNGLDYKGWTLDTVVKEG